MKTANLIVLEGGGAVEIKPFYSEADFIGHTDWATPVWAILVDELTGRVITQVSYPQPK